MELLAFNHHANGVIFFSSERNAPSRRHRARSSFASKTVRFNKKFLQTDGTGVVVKTVETRNFLEFFSLFL